MIFDRKINTDIIKNLGNEYTYELFMKINDIIEKNFDNISSFVNTIDFFRYLQNRYCMNKDLINKLAYATGREIHNLSNQQKKQLDLECNRFSNGTNEKEACTSKMLCQFIIYSESKKELSSIEYTNMIEKITGHLLLYYMVLIKIYTKILRDMQNMAYKSGIMWSQEDYKVLNNIVQSKYAYYE